MLLANPSTINFVLVFSIKTQSIILSKTKYYVIKHKKMAAPADPSIKKI